MATGQQFAADFGVGFQICACQIFNLDGSFVVFELADEILASADVRPAEKRIGLDLHGTLALGDALAVVLRRVRVRQIGRVG